MDILTYLQDYKISVGEDKFYNKCTYSNEEEAIKNQINLIVEIQAILKKQKSTIIPRVDSTIGKELENFKVAIRKNSKNIILLSNKEALTDSEEFILVFGKEIIQRAERSLDTILRNDYIELIKRSMSNYEICLGRVDEGNIRADLEGNKIIRTLKYMSYNLIEHDIYNYIKKLKKRRYEGDLNGLIYYFINNAQLDTVSYIYIRALVNYPIEQIKVLTKYFSEKEIKTLNQWREEMNLAIKNDGKELR